MSVARGALCPVAIDSWLVASRCSTALCCYRAQRTKSRTGRKKQRAVQKVIRTPLAAWHTEVRAGQYLHTTVSANNALALDDRLPFWGRKFSPQSAFCLCVLPRLPRTVSQDIEQHDGCLTVLHWHSRMWHSAFWDGLTGCCSFLFI
jgi:hypothetical protein